MSRLLTGQAARLRATASAGSISRNSTARLFRTSCAASGAHSYNEDHVVPDFYLQHKRRKETQLNKTLEELHESGETPTNLPSGDAGVMANLSDHILSDNMAASTKRLGNKIPRELLNHDGVMSHSSGFVIPTPGEAPKYMSERRVRDRTIETANVRERVMEESSLKLEGIDASHATTRLRAGKVPFEHVTEDGTVIHPSGFEVPTAEHHFKYSDSSSVDNSLADAVERQRRRGMRAAESEAEKAARYRKSEELMLDESDAELMAELRASVKEIEKK